MGYRETIRPPWWTYATLAASTALLCFAMAAAITVPAAIVVYAVLVVIGSWTITKRTVRVVVDESGLHVAGRSLAHSQITAVQALDAEGLRQAAGPDADARAVLILRDLSASGGVKIDLCDDQVPYWLVSSRSPADLAHALQL